MSDVFEFGGESSGLGSTRLAVHMFACEMSQRDHRLKRMADSVQSARDETSNELAGIVWVIKGAQTNRRAEVNWVGRQSGAVRSLIIRHVIIF